MFENEEKFGDVTFAFGTMLSFLSCDRCPKLAGRAAKSLKEIGERPPTGGLKTLDGWGREVTDPSSGSETRARSAA